MNLSGWQKITRTDIDLGSMKSVPTLYFDDYHKDFFHKFRL